MTTATTGLVTLFGLDPATYRPHELHTSPRTYVETNCYTDILIELLHARGDEPLALMGSTLRTDFEGDQWTFFKPAQSDMESLFGIDIHEMQPYRALPLQLSEQLAEGRTLIVELDSWYLPDTASTSYRREHVKTSVAVEGIDPTAQRLRYFHNLGLHELDGDDFRGVFRLGRHFSDDVLPPYTEIVRFDAGPRLAGDELRTAARDLFRQHLERRPSTNPFERFGLQLERALAGLLEGDAAAYHDYAFATVRMVGAAFELGASHVDWLLEGKTSTGADALREIVEGCKVLSFKLARRRQFDPQPALATLATSWERGVAALDVTFAR